MLHILILSINRMMCLVILGYYKRILACCLKISKLLSLILSYLIKIRLHCLIPVILAHVYYLLIQ